ncbi:Ring 1b [Gossypium australe]|uniref:Ring 1b n=1 Tax=Gossypium australe TaxID=47621 RepID=A0A5B6V0B8_9ROSI|nr:Ring 1b [Gossypium australe]
MHQPLGGCTANLGRFWHIGRGKVASKIAAMLKVRVLQDTQDIESRETVKVKGGYAMIVVTLRICNARRHKASVAETKLTAISTWCLDGRLLLQ